MSDEERGSVLSLIELRAAVQHTSLRLALYRRRTYLGRGDPKRLAELERVAQGAKERLRRARAHDRQPTP